MISVVQLGRVDYSTALRLQQTLVDLRKSNSIPNTLLLLEHPPVITLGRNASQENLVASPDLLRQRGVELFETDRGGDVTFHGPGQLVGYPIFDLRSFPTPEGKRATLGAVEFVRRMEEALIRACADFAIPCQRVKGLTGVWTQPAGSQPESKIAAIGVHISRGVTSHGFALNVTTDLDFFQLIVPCGIADKPVTSIARELAGASRPVPSLDQVAESVVRHFGFVFQSQILWVEILDALLGRAVGVPLKEPADLQKLHAHDKPWA